MLLTRLRPKETGTPADTRTGTGATRGEAAPWLLRSPENLDSGPYRLSVCFKSHQQTDNKTNTIANKQRSSQSQHL